MTVKIKLDHAGIRDILTNQCRSLVDGAAAAIAAETISQLPAGTDVVVDGYTTDRAAAVVVIRDVRGRAWQAKNGVLTRAAAAAGLQVSPPKRTRR